jgi:hypothetical protein
VSHDQTAFSSQDDQVDAPVGRLRLFPSVTFGVRAAALSGIALPIALLAAGVVAGGPAHIADGGDWPMGTTCCPPSPR